MTDGSSTSIARVAAAKPASDLDGIKKMVDPGPPYMGNCYQIKDPASCQMMPRSLGMALDAMEGDHGIVSFFGPEFVKAYLALKRMEYRWFLDHVIDWEFEEYSWCL